MMKAQDRIEYLLADAERLASLGRIDAALARLLQLENCISANMQALPADLLAKLNTLRNAVGGANSG